MSVPPRPRLGVIVPAFNEESNLPELFQELRKTLHEHQIDAEVLLVDDGSTDQTWDMAQEEARRWPALRVLRHRRNLGKTEAMLSAARASQAEMFVLFDADLQHSTEEIPRFLARLEEGWDMVTGKKTGHYEKQFVSGIYNSLSRALFQVPVSDLNSMKAFRREVIAEIPLRHDWHRFFAVLAHVRGFRLTEIEVPLYPRRHGESKYRGQARIWRGLIDLICVVFAIRFSQSPMRLFGSAGALLGVLALLIGVLTVTARLNHWVSPIGYRPFLTLVVLLMTVGTLFVGFGLVAELIAQQRSEIESLRDEVRQKL